MPDSAVSGRLLRCDAAYRRKKCPSFADKPSLCTILFPKGVDNSVFLWYNFFKMIEFYSDNGVSGNSILLKLNLFY